VEVTVDLIRVNKVHFESAMRDRREYEFAAVEIFVTRGDGQLLRQVPTSCRRPPSSSVTERSQHGQ
jgi:hypothetical protein